MLTILTLIVVGLLFKRGDARGLLCIFILIYIFYTIFLYKISRYFESGLQVCVNKMQNMYTNSVLAEKFKKTKNKCMVKGSGHYW